MNDAGRLRAKGVIVGGPALKSLADTQNTPRPWSKARPARRADRPLQSVERRGSEPVQRSWRAAPQACALIALLVFRTLPVRAQTDPQREQARQLAARGFDALQHKDYATAEDLFRRADELVHAPTLVVDHARSLVGLGKLVEAHEGFELVLREGVSANAPWQWKQAVATAAAELAAVEPRLAWLTITVKGPATASVQIDGKPVPDAARGVRRATNPGVRTVTVRADRFLPMDKVVSLKEGQSAVVAFALEPDPDAPPLPVKPKTREVVVVVEGPKAPKPPDHTLGTILLSAGGVGLATGAITGLLALRTRSDLNKSCSGSVCAPNDDGEYADYRQKIDRYRGLGTASGVAFALGVGATLGGAGLFLFASGGKGSRTSGALRLGPGSVEVSGHF